VIERHLPAGHVWLRITRPQYSDPFDTAFAQRGGGRWNPPHSWPTLYLNEDRVTVHAQVRHMFAGRAIDPDDLDDNAPFHLAAATLPDRQRVADVTTAAGATAAGLPATYPLDENGKLVAHNVTQPVGAAARGRSLRGVWCLSAALAGRELAWFPARRSAPRPHWDTPKGFGAWRHARSLADVEEPSRLTLRG